MQKTYPGDNNRKEEVSQYVENIISSNQAIFNFEEGSEQTNIMLNHYKKANPDLDRKNAIRFQRLLSFNCPMLRFE